MFYGGDAARIAASNDTFDLLGHGQKFFLCDLSVFDDIDSDIVVNEAQDIQIQGIHVALYLQNILLAHDITAGIFDNGHRAVQFIQAQLMINKHSAAGFDMIQYETFFDLSYVQHNCPFFALLFNLNIQ